MLNRESSQSVEYNPMVYESAEGNLFQPIRVMVPAEALTRAAELNAGNSVVRVVNILHRTSALFPSNESTKWVG